VLVFFLKGLPEPLLPFGDFNPLSLKALEKNGFLVVF
jgi:hypothetical protein